MRFQYKLDSLTAFYFNLSLIRDVLSISKGENKILILDSKRVKAIMIQ